jgi:Fe2+ or Zn2+ uptake regulation protein
VLSHSHGADGREEFHVLPDSEHGHLYCQRCGAQWELTADDPAVVAAVDAFAAQRGFAVDVSHLTMIGRCEACRTAADPATEFADTSR